MKDWVNAFVEKIEAPGFVKSLVDHNRGLFLALVVSCIFVAGFAGCSISTKSPVDGSAVTRDQLDAQASVAARDLAAKTVALKTSTDSQIAALQSKMKADADALGVDAANLKDKLGPAYADLERKEAAADTVVNVLDGLIKQYAPAPFAGIAGSVLTAGLLGLGYDNRRKDRLIAGSGGPAAPIVPTPPVIPPVA